DGKVAIITGAGSGMGKTSVEVFLREGGRGVVAADISGAQNDTAKVMGDSVIPVHCDVTKESDVIAMINTAVERFGRADAVMTVAGVSGMKPMLDVSQDEYNFQFDVLLRGVWFGTTHGIRAMVKTGGGVVLNWASVAALIAIPNTGPYAAFKSGVIA